MEMINSCNFGTTLGGLCCQFDEYRFDEYRFDEYRFKYLIVIETPSFCDSFSRLNYLIKKIQIKS